MGEWRIMADFEALVTVMFKMVGLYDFHGNNRLRHTIGKRQDRPAMLLEDA